VDFDSFCDELKSLFFRFRSRDAARKIRYISAEAGVTLFKDYCVFHREEHLVFQASLLKRIIERSGRNVDTGLSRHCYSAGLGRVVELTMASACAY
jgi:hypothetical protein